MYTVEKNHLLMLEPTSAVPGDGHIMEVPLIIDEMSQNLAVWLSTPGSVSLGAGSIAIVRNKEVLSTTNFSGNTMVIPLNVYTVGADFEMELIHPQTTIARPHQSVFRYDPDTAAVVEEKNDLGRYAAAKPISLSAIITNGDAVRKNITLKWVALVWRNV